MTSYEYSLECKKAYEAIGYDQWRNNKCAGAQALSFEGLMHVASHPEEPWVDGWWDICMEEFNKRIENILFKDSV